MPIYVAAGFSTAFLPVWLTVRGLTPADIGEVLGLATLCRLLAVPAWGWIADGVGRRRPVLLASTALTAFFSAAYLPAAGFAPLLLVTALQGMAAAALMPLTDTLALALAGDGRLDYGRVRAVGSFAFMAATAAAGSLVAGFGARIVPLALTLCYALAIPLLWPVPEAGPPPRAPRATGGLRLLSSRPFLLTMAASALIQSAHGAYYGLATLHCRAHGISDVTIGLLWS
ncbi:MAG: MFS transporter, partial [Rhodospirillales bacterium]|nr:MFS transporter [Rhodospirillales bacterium]